MFCDPIGSDRFEDSRICKLSQNAALLVGSDDLTRRSMLTNLDLKIGVQRVYSALSTDS